MSMRDFIRKVLFLTSCAAVMIFSAGCATSDPDRESDMPWNMPQSWEGAPSIPGMNQ